MRSVEEKEQKEKRKKRTLPYRQSLKVAFGIAVNGPNLKGKQIFNEETSVFQHDYFRRNVYNVSDFFLYSICAMCKMLVVIFFYR